MRDGPAAFSKTRPTRPRLAPPEGWLRPNPSHNLPAEWRPQVTNRAHRPSSSLPKLSGFLGFFLHLRNKDGTCLEGRHCYQLKETPLPLNGVGTAPEKPYDPATRLRNQLYTLHVQHKEGCELFKLTNHPPGTTSLPSKKRHPRSILGNLRALFGFNGRLRGALFAGWFLHLPTDSPALRTLPPLGTQNERLVHTAPYPVVQQSNCLPPAAQRGKNKARLGAFLLHRGLLFADLCGEDIRRGGLCFSRWRAAGEVAEYAENAHYMIAWRFGRTLRKHTVYQLVMRITIY